MTGSGAGALAGLRVLDLSGHRAQFCARLLADMGADVIKIEPPAGDDARRIGPFLDDLPHRDRSLFFWFYNLNKRSLTLDLNHSRGADIFLQLARSADVVIESFAPGTLDRLGLSWEVLHRENPALVLCSIAPFGQTGPYRDFVADDTVLTALGGMLYVNGFPNHAPVRPLGLQAYHSSAYFGAIAVMLALLARDATCRRPMDRPQHAGGDGRGGRARRRLDTSSATRPSRAAALCTGAGFFASANAATVTSCIARSAIGPRSSNGSSPTAKAPTSTGPTISSRCIAT